MPGQSALGEDGVLGGGCLKPVWAAGTDLLGQLGGTPLVLRRSSLRKPEIQEGEDKNGACTVPQELVTTERGSRAAEQSQERPGSPELPLGPESVWPPSSNVGRVSEVLASTSSCG